MQNPITLIDPSSPARRTSMSANRLISPTVRFWNNVRQHDGSRNDSFIPPSRWRVLLSRRYLVSDHLLDYRSVQDRPFHSIPFLSINRFYVDMGSCDYRCEATSTTGQSHSKCARKRVDCVLHHVDSIDGQGISGKSPKTAAGRDSCVSLAGINFTLNCHLRQLVKHPRYTH